MSSQSGTVKWFNESRRVGLITPDDGSVDLYAHVDQIDGGGFKGLFESQRVRFDVKLDEKGRKAVHICPL
ncbi:MULTISPECIES: cold shock domain-containing protein [unclassified Methylibium]|uniref:cold shock domain-containing protein n=1 Tax=unclassified Methylibium TaxID=2633235 RepID=UPI0006F66616|nr:cold shock domain-containing protein [Methylibium sp. Root1272]KQW66183.1 cold-shock protein [Methylibium sp. Root1272]